MARRASTRSAAKVATPATYWQWSGTTCESTGAPAVDYYATTVVAPSDLVTVTTAAE
jgi:hypothetical protein